MAEDEMRSRKAEGYVQRTADPEFAVLHDTCQGFEGRHYCAATSFDLGLRIAPDGTASVALLIAKGGHGYHQLLTCHGAREIGQGLIEMAAELEQREAEQAKAQLAETLNRRKQP